MPRIIDVETEAFAPTYRSTYQPPREDPRDASLRRMGARLQLAGQVAPLVGMGIKGIDQYLVTPIQQAMKESREGEYKESKAGESLYEPGETPMQKLAKQRLALKEKQTPFDTSAWEKEAEEMYDITKMKGEPSLQAQRPDYGAVGEEVAKMFGEERPEFEEYYAKEEAAKPEQAKIAPREEMPSFQTKGPVVFRNPRTGELMPAQPGALTQGSPAYAMEASRQVTGLPPKPKAPAPAELTPTRMMPIRPYEEGYEWPARGRYTAPGAPTEGFAGTEAPSEPTQTAQMAKAATTTARGGAPAETELAEPTKPKTLATATDDELAMAKRKLENLVNQNPQDPEFANRLKMVELEQRHRGEKMEYEDWAAQARAADTLEEQRRVLEMAKNVRMPVEGVESLLTSPFERAKLKALGTREEKGLFPEVARPLNEWEVQKKQVEIRIGQLKAQGLPEKQAAEQALAELRRAKAGLARGQAERVSTMLEPEYVSAWQKAALARAQEEKAAAETQKILELLPGQKQKLADESAKLKALAAKARASIRRGGAGLSSDELKWVKEINDRRNEMVNQATKVEMEAEAQYGRLEGIAERAKTAAERAAVDVNKLGPEGIDEAENRKIRQAQAEAEAAQKAYEQAEIDRRAASKARTEAQTNKRNALRAGDADKADADFLTDVAMRKRGITLPSRANAPAAPPARKAEEEGGLVGAVRGIFGGGAKPAKPATKGKSKIDDFFGE